MNPTIKEGDIFESLLDGTEYIVENVLNKMVVLSSRTGSKEILTAIDTLKTKSLYREKVHEVNR